MRHVEVALNNMTVDHPGDKDFISIKNKKVLHGIPAIVSFTIQSDPVLDVGVNGVQATDMLEYVKCLFQSLNKAIPNRETALTITKLEEALHWQEARTKNRIKRRVEGTMKP